MDTDIIILDEPTSELDVGATSRIIEILQDLKARGKTIIIVDHSLEGYRNVADRVIVMEEGHISREGTFNEIFPEQQGSMKALYTDPDLEPYSPANRPVIATIDSLIKRYGTIEALSGVSLTLYEGEFIAILGENGSGKTTLVKHLNGLLRPDGDLSMCEAWMQPRHRSSILSGRPALCFKTLIPCSLLTVSEMRSCLALRISEQTPLTRSLEMCSPWSGYQALKQPIPGTFHGVNGSGLRLPVFLP